MDPTPTSAISRTQQGEETRRNILRLAVDIASRKGLGALTIGDLAKELGMSKSGLFAHFGSKEDLQIATIEAAEKVFGAAIIKPANGAKPGLTRLMALLDGYIRYLEGSVFSGGCFFSAVAAEFDDRPGRIRDRIAQSMHSWCQLLEAEVHNALDSAELQAVEAEQLAFELQALTHHANFRFRLMGDSQASRRALRGMYQQLWNVATPKGRILLRNPDSN